MESKVIAIFGRRGSGKSTLFQSILRRSRRLIVIDPLGEHNIGRVCYDRNDVLNYTTKADAFRIVYRPLADNQEQEIAFVDWCAYLAENLCDITFAVDEVDNYTNPYYMSNGLRRIIHYGRHYNIAVVMASRQANRIRNDITAQADIILSFQQQGRQAISYMADFDDKDIVGGLLTMKQHNFVMIRGEKSLDKLIELP